MERGVGKNMLFKVTKRFRTHSINKSAEKYVLYVKWCDARTKSKRSKHTEYGRYDSREEAIESYKKLSQMKSQWPTYSLSDDFRVRLIKQTYSEESVSVPTTKEMTDRIPELKGIF